MCRFFREEDAASVAEVSSCHASMQQAELINRNNASFDVPQNSAEQIHVALQPDQDHQSSSIQKTGKEVGTSVQHDNAVGNC
jgi:hypothetical protein